MSDLSHHNSRFARSPAAIVDSSWNHWRTLAERSKFERDDKGSTEYFSRALFCLDEITFSAMREPQKDSRRVLSELRERWKRYHPMGLEGRAPQAKMNALHSFMYDEMKFSVSTTSIQTPQHLDAALRNLNLASTLMLKRGSPMLLSAVYKILASDIQLPTSGVSLPGLFCVQVHDGEGPVLVNPTNGRAVSTEEAQSIVRNYDSKIVWSRELLDPISLYEWPNTITADLARICLTKSDSTNLAKSYAFRLARNESDDYALRALALTLFDVGGQDLQSAKNLLRLYLEKNPKDPFSVDLRNRLNAG